MGRASFTNAITKLLSMMIADGHVPVIDYVNRSSYEQRRLYDAGLTKCDGTKRVSKHQKCEAMDIYFVIDGKICFDYDRSPLALSLARKYHDEWVKMGGQPMIEWDKPHYEF
jgi:hypothetical protein